MLTRALVAQQTASFDFRGRSTKSSSPHLNSSYAQLTAPSALMLTSPDEADSKSPAWNVSKAHTLEPVNLVTKGFVSSHYLLAKRACHIQTRELLHETQDNVKVSMYSLPHRPHTSRWLRQVALKGYNVTRRVSFAVAEQAFTN